MVIDIVIDLEVARQAF